MGFELLEVTLLDLLHKRFAAQEITAQVGGKLAGHDQKLVVKDLGEKNGAARGD